MQDVDIIYNLLTFLNSTQEEDMYASIAETIIWNLDKIPTININDLADLCYTSTATISRFCKRFNCHNFAQFKIEVKEGLEKAKKEIVLSEEERQRMQQYPEFAIDKVYDLLNESLTLGRANLNIHEIDRICHMIHGSKKIHFHGFQFNKIVAADIQLKFIKLGKFIYAFNERGDNSHKLDLLSEDSLVIFISVLGKDEYLPLIQDMKNRNAKILLVTMNSQSSLSPLVDYTFVIEGKESDFTDSSISGTVGFLAALNVLYVRYGILYPK